MRRSRERLGKERRRGGSDAVNSVDPNQKLGPSGVGNASWLPAGSLFNYRIDFENDENASAPAQRVDITDQLQSGAFDLNSFRLTEFGYGDQLYTISGSDVSWYSNTVPLILNGSDTGYEVVFEAGIDDEGLFTASFRTIDPSFYNLPPSADIGFIPPEDGSGCGMGHVSFTIRGAADIASGLFVRLFSFSHFFRNFFLTFCFAGYEYCNYRF